MEQFVRNVVKDVPGVEVRVLLPPDYGCPHHYYLTPRDMNIAAWGDVLVINGLGLEEFSEKTLLSANENLKILNASEGISMLTSRGDDGHDHEGMNPHLFSSPREAAMQVRNIARYLSEIDSVNAKKYQANGVLYAGKLDSLADVFQVVIASAENRKVVTIHNVFDYLARDTGLEIIGVLDSEPGQEPSAGKMLELVNYINTNKPAAILIEPQYPVQAAKSVSDETGVPMFILDPVASGTSDADHDYYIRTMEKNLNILRRALGVE